MPRAACARAAGGAWRIPPAAVYQSRRIAPIRFVHERPTSNAVPCTNRSDQRPTRGGKGSTGLSYRVPLALIVVLLAILGALLHPLALALGLFPFDTAPLISILAGIREGIADLLGWGVLALLAGMVLYVARGRRIQRRPELARDFASSGNKALLQPRAV